MIFAKKIDRFIDAMSRRQLLNWMPDSLYLKIRFQLKTGYRLKLENPITFNEKIQWLKLYNHCPEYIQMVDKFNAKDYAADVIGMEYVIPNVGGPWEEFDQIDFNSLPDKFILKCTHDSGGTVLCTNNNEFDVVTAKKKIQK